jgi:carboxyl-terminal processing protease
VGDGAALLLTIAHYYTPSGRLIQRDYSHKSFFEYYYSRKDAGTETQEVKATDGGRKVYGGGGITPDEKYPSPKYSILQRRLGPVTGGADMFYRFASNYFGTKKPELPEGWQPNADVMEKFRTYLKSQNVPFTDSEFDGQKDWVRGRIRWEFYYRAFGKNAAERAKWADDAEVLKAIENLPKAQSLQNQASKIYAMRR